MPKINAQSSQEVSKGIEEVLTPKKCIEKRGGPKIIDSNHFKMIHSNLYNTYIDNIYKNK